jgi:hypothetical protein
VASILPHPLGVRPRLVARLRFGLNGTRMHNASRSASFLDYVDDSSFLIVPVGKLCFDFIERQANQPLVADEITDIHVALVVGRLAQTCGAETLCRPKRDSRRKSPSSRWSATPLAPPTATVYG